MKSNAESESERLRKEYEERGGQVTRYARGESGNPDELGGWPKNRRAYRERVEAARGD